MINFKKTILFNIGTILLGVLLPFAFAPYEVFPLAIVSVGGLLFLILKATPKQAFSLGFWFGAGYFGAGVYWVYISIHYIGDVPIPLSLLITSAMVAILSLYPGFTCYLTTLYPRSLTSQRILLVFPAIWVMSEWARSWLFGGFPWLLLGYSQTNSPLKGLAPLFGVYGVSLAVVLSAALLINALLKLKQKHYPLAYLNLLFLTFIWIAGSGFSLVSWTKPVSKPISVALVQGNIPQIVKWSPSHLQLSFDRYINLTEPLWGHYQLIVWPESAIPVPLQRIEDFINNLNAKADATNTQLILGIPIETADETGYYNAMITLGKEQKVYLKRILVPFGEYIPQIPFLAKFIDFLHVPLSNLLPGKASQPPLTLGNLKILPAICSEIAYPELMYSKDKTVNVLLTITNDGWFGKSNAQAQHLQMAIMRALEFQRSVIFASNDGITAIINPNGNLDVAAPTHQPFVLTGNAQSMQGLTPWMRFGTNPILFILLSMLIAAILFKIQMLRALKTPVPEQIQSK